VRYLYLSNFSRADDLFARALELLPDDLDLYLGLGILHEYSGEDGRSADAFQHALELDPNNVRARVSLGIAYAMSGEYQSAFAEYQKAKEIDPTIENPHQRLGRDYYLDGAIEEAASEFAQAVSEEPGEPAAYFYLMDCYNRMSRSDDALDMYETIRLKFGNDPENACGYYEYFHMHREAIAALETLVGRCPDDPELRFRLAQVYKETGRLDDAVKEARTGAQLDPEDHHIHAFLGRLLFERGDCLSAAAACRRAVELNHYDQGAYVTLADSLLFLGRDEEAQKTVEEMEHNREQAWQRYRDKFSGGPPDGPGR
jgi:Flp pilus assembly protein TadD